MLTIGVKNQRRLIFKRIYCLFKVRNKLNLADPDDETLRHGHGTIRAISTHGTHKTHRLIDS